MQAINFGNSEDDSGAGQVAMSADGTLVYATGGPMPAADAHAGAWFDRNGGVEAIELPDRPYPVAAHRAGRPAHRHDHRARFGAARVWVHDLLRGGLSAVTSTEDFAFATTSGPGTGSASHLRSGGRHIGLRSADGTGEVERLHTSATTSASPSSWSGDGRLLAFVEGHPVTAADIWIRDRL